MAEAALFSIASKVLSTIATPAFEKAYERARSVWGAKDELKELKKTITTIRAVLLDAEKQQTNSATVKNWVGRVREVLYDAEDLFDVVATDDLLKQQIKEKKPLKEASTSTKCWVRVILSKINPIASSDFIAKKVKAIREDLDRITKDMALFGFVNCESEIPISGMRRGVETGSSVGQDEIIGRDKEKNEVVDFVYDQKYAARNISLVAIVGIGGIGKTALAQLVYKDAKICGGFQLKYWACISNILNEKDVLGKIYQSLTGEKEYEGLSVDQLETGISESVDKEERFLLVLDDLWVDDVGRGRKLQSILSIEKAKGSKIIITTRNLSVAKAMGADKILELKPLSLVASWALFRRYAFTEDQENDPDRIRIGKEIVSKCANHPLAIKSVASLLSRKDTITEWISMGNQELSMIDPIMSALRLSYDDLPSHLKNCFAYCSLFPKDYRLKKQNLIYLWVAQGYIKPENDETLEMAGHACFMELFRRSFFQDPKMDYLGGEIESCMMHDLIHNLAQEVAGEESCIIKIQETNQSHNKIRHLAVEIDDKSSNIPLLSFKADRLRSSLFRCKHSCSSQLLDGQVTKFRFLRALSLEDQSMESVPRSIGEMKHLRYLNLSGNEFTHLPDFTKLVNLITLDISRCANLEELPREIRGLVGLRHLINNGCSKLVCRPSILSEMTSLDHLSELKVSDMLFEPGQIPDIAETILISNYPSMRLPVWWRDIRPASRVPKLEHLTISSCNNVSNLAPIRCIPSLKTLDIEFLPILEYIEEEDVVGPTTPFFPSLRSLKILKLANLKGWSRPKKLVAVPNVKCPSKTDHPLKFPFLSTLLLKSCPDLASWPPVAPRLKTLALEYVSEELVPQFLSKTYTDLESIRINGYENLTSFPGERFASLRVLQFTQCENLKHVRFASPNLIEKFTVRMCPNLDLWEGTKEEERSVDWDSFSKLRTIGYDTFPVGRNYLFERHIGFIDEVQLYSSNGDWDLANLRLPPDVYRTG